MTQFSALQEAMYAWMVDAAASLMTDHDARYEGLGLHGWDRDADGIFRNIARPIDGWDFRYLRRLQHLASWLTVEKVFQEDSRLSLQVDTLVGTIQGGSRVEAFGLAAHVIPRPGELDRAGEVFEQRYLELEAYLVADELEFKTIWPVPGLIVDCMPIALEPYIVLDPMSDSELVTALRAETVRPLFPNDMLFRAESANRSCVRYRYRLPKLIGSRGDDASLRFQELEQRLQDIRATIEESLALVLPEPVMTAGRFGVSGEQWSPQSGGVSFQQSTMAR